MIPAIRKTIFPGASALAFCLAFLSLAGRANAAGWFEYFYAAGIRAQAASIVSQNGTLVLTVTPSTYRWQSIGQNGIPSASQQRSDTLQQLVDAWPAVYGTAPANAVLTITKGLKTLNLSVNLPQPVLTNGELSFTGVTSGPLSPELRRVFFGPVANPSSSLPPGAYAAFTLIIGNSGRVPHDILSAAIQYDASNESTDSFSATTPCSDLIPNEVPSTPPRPGTSDVSKEISYIVKYTNDRDDLSKQLVAPWGSKITLTPDNVVAIARASVLPCDPAIDLNDPGANPANVQTVMSILTEAKWNELTTLVGKYEAAGSFDASSFSYQNFLRIIGRSPFFCGEPGAFDDVSEACKRDLAMVFAHSAQETGAHLAPPPPQWQQAFAFIREQSCYTNPGGCPAYNPIPASVCPGVRTAGNPFICPVINDPGNTQLQFYGRGIKQLSYFYNYSGFGAQYLGDLNALLASPDKVGQDGALAIASGIWFAMAPQPPKPAMHDLITGNGSYQPKAAVGGLALTRAKVRKYDLASNTFEEVQLDVPVDPFMATISVINGGIECKTGGGVQQAINRISYYYNLLNFFGAKLTPVEAAYATTNNGCTLAQGDLFGANEPLRYSPVWWIQLPAGEQICGAVSYGVTVPISIVPDQNWNCVCTPQTGKCPQPKNGE